MAAIFEAKSMSASPFLLILSARLPPFCQECSESYCFHFGFKVMLQFTNLVFDTVEKSLEIKNGIEAKSDIIKLTYMAKAEKNCVRDFWKRSGFINF